MNTVPGQNTKLLE